MAQKLRIIPVGGLGEIGKNMMYIEYGNNALIVDAGLMFPENDMLGIDYIIPDFRALADKKDLVRGIVITHGHEDHHGALPYVLPHAPAPIYATRLTRGFIEVKLKEHRLLGSAEIVTIAAGETIEVGPFRVEPFRVGHSIPDAVGFAVDTPLGLVLHSGEYKFDLTPVSGKSTDLHALAAYGQRGVLALMADSTNAERHGHTPSVSVVREALEHVFERAEGRIILATFASNISRVQEVVNVAEDFGRKVGLAGRSMEQNIAMARNLGYLEAAEGTLVGLKELDALPDDEVVVCCTGTQGEPTSALVRMANDTHRDLSLRPGDTVVGAAVAAGTATASVAAAVAASVAVRDRRMRFSQVACMYLDIRLISLHRLCPARWLRFSAAQSAQRVTGIQWCRPSSRTSCPNGSGKWQAPTVIPSCSMRWTHSARVAAALPGSMSNPHLIAGSVTWAGCSHMSPTSAARSPADLTSSVLLPGVWPGVGMSVSPGATARSPSTRSTTPISTSGATVSPTYGTGNASCTSGRRQASQSRAGSR